MSAEQKPSFPQIGLNGGAADENICTFRHSGAADKFAAAERLIGRKADAIHRGGLRTRLNLAIFWDGARRGEGRLCYAMFENGRRVLNPPLDFAAPEIAEIAAKLLAALSEIAAGDEEFKQFLNKLFEVRFYLTSEQLVCVLLFHRALGGLALAALREFLQPLCARRLELVALARGQRQATCEHFEHRSAFARYFFDELCFIQPSLAMNENMLQFAISCMLPPGDFAGASEKSASMNSHVLSSADFSSQPTNSSRDSVANAVLPSGGGMAVTGKNSSAPTSPDAPAFSARAEDLAPAQTPIIKSPAEQPAEQSVESPIAQASRGDLAGCEQKPSEDRTCSSSSEVFAKLPPNHPRGQASDDLLELYCGYGNFSLALAPYFRRVFATEIAKHNAHFLAQNAAANNAVNIYTARLSDAEVAEYFAGTREFRRCAHLPDGWRFSTALIDPPRSGAQSCLALISQMQRIIYISCNPLTLARDLKQLERTHRIARFEIFDQFINSEHLECGILLVKKEEK